VIFANFFAVRKTSTNISWVRRPVKAELPAADRSRRRAIIWTPDTPDVS
jgi:hypothetical protein